MGRWVWLVMLVALVLGSLISGWGCATGRGDQDSSTGDPATTSDFSATDLEGYWRCSRDSSVTHITNVGLPGGGSGSCTPPGGTMVPDGKFRSIRFLGGNQWEAMEKERPVAGPAGEPDDPFAWRRVIIELLDRNTFRIGKTLFRRV